MIHTLHQEGARAGDGTRRGAAHCNTRPKHTKQRRPKFDAVGERLALSERVVAAAVAFKNIDPFEEGQPVRSVSNCFDFTAASA